jgi:hypothetical protein
MVLDFKTGFFITLGVLGAVLLVALVTKFT